MTNGEMIQKMFPSAEIDKGKDGNDIIWIAIDCWTTFTKDWWNAECKEPTTKNDLGVDCISREQAINAVNMCSNSETILNLQQLPSVTLQESILDEIRDKIQAIYIGNRNGYEIMADVLKIIDKYRTESEDDV